MVNNAELSRLYLQWSATRTDADQDVLFVAIRKLAVRMCPRNEDAVQDAMIAIHAKISSFRPEDAAKFPWWCRAVVSRERMGAARAITRLREDEIVPDSHSSGHNRNQLPDEYVDTTGLGPMRRVVALGLMEGYSLREIASALDMRYDTLRQNLRRIRAAELSQNPPVVPLVCRRGEACRCQPE